MRRDDKKKTPRLKIHRETVRKLQSEELLPVVGGRIKLTNIRTSCTCDPTLPITVCGA